MPSKLTSAELDAVKFYDPAVDNYDLEKDPRCLYGWGPPVCRCGFGHGCFRPLGHRGKCWDGGEPARQGLTLPCERRQRPADWDSTGRTEANR